MSNDNAKTEEIAQNIRGAIGLITEEVAAQVLLLNSVGTLATWRHQKKGPPHVKLGKRVFYTIADLSGWIATTGREQIAAAEAEAAQVAA